MYSKELIKKISTANFVTVFTGAGISAESGVPTFRGADGLWKKFRPEELASFNAFLNNPDLVWEWYKYRKEIIANIKPNPGHVALAEMEKIFKFFTIITQNVDNLHRRAGSQNVFELHGNIERNYCVSCRRKYSNEDIGKIKNVPRCSCGGLIRPDVVWFGETLPQGQWNAGVSAAEHSEIFISVGTSAVVYPAASLPSIAKQSGAYLIEINVEPTEVSSIFDEVLLGKSGEILPSLMQIIISH
jgi:NAD-dependent deacetylase